MTPGRLAAAQEREGFAKPLGRRYIAGIVSFPAEPTEQF